MTIKQENKIQAALTDYSRALEDVNRARRELEAFEEKAALMHKRWHRASQGVQ